MKEFDLELAKQGKPVCTRKGDPARIICFDRKACSDYEADDYSMAVLIDNGRYEELHVYSIDGKANVTVDYAKGYDLMMVEEKKTMWMNIYKSGKSRTNDGLYQTKESALDSININAANIDDGSYITTVKVEWEE